MKKKIMKEQKRNGEHENDPFANKNNNGNKRIVCQPNH